MDLPPPTYGLLLGPTLLLIPLITRLASDAAKARLARRVLYALALLEVALVLLYYSKLVCWILAGISACLLAAAAFPADRRAATFSILPLALAAGLSFQFMPGETGFLAYFAVGLPLMLGLPLAVLAAQWLRWDAGPRAALAAIAVLAFAGAFAASAFAQDFLQLFEVTHLPILLIALAAFAWLLGRGARGSDEARAAALAAMDPGEYAARDAPRLAPLHRWCTAGASLCLFAGYAVIIDAGPTLRFVTETGAALALVGVTGSLALPRRTRVALAASLCQFIAALLLPLAPANEQYLGAGGVTLTPYLVLGALAATLALTGVSAAWAGHLDARRRDQVLAPEAKTPAGFLQLVTGRAPTVHDVEAFARDVRALGASGGILTVRAPAQDPLWTLPEPVYQWLERQEDPRARVHVAIVEAGTTFHVPPILPEERDA